MKKYQSLAVLFFLFCFSSLASAQVIADTTRTASFTAANESRTITTEGRQSVGFVLSGTWSATIRVDLSSDNTRTWETSVDIYDVSAKTFSTSVTANGTYTIGSVGGMSHARLFVSSYTSGTVLVALRSSVGGSVTEVGIQGSVTAVQTTHDNLNANANLQVGDTDVSTSNLVPVGGAAADGAAVVGNPVLVAGSDGTNAETILTDSTGAQVAVGAAADGAAAVGDPIPIAGVDSSGNVQALSVGPSGTMAQVAVGGADGLTNVRLGVWRSNSGLNLVAESASSQICCRHCNHYEDLWLPEKALEK